MNILNTINNNAQTMTAMLPTESQRGLAGKLTYQCFRLVAALELATPFALCLFVFAVPAFAQTLPDGGVFADGAGGANFSNTSKAVFTFVKWLAFVGGVVFALWAILNGGAGRPFLRQLLGAVGCFGFSGILYLLFRVGTGQDAGLGIN